jgi:hypothetical protein
MNTDTMRRALKAIAGAALTLCSVAALAADAPEHLLPTDAATHVNVTYTQDGFALYVTLINDSDLVLTSASVTCNHYEPAKPVPASCPKPVPDTLSKEQIDAIFDEVQGKKPKPQKAPPPRPKYRPECETSSTFATVWSQTVQIKVMPHQKSAPIYGELPYNNAATSCSVRNERGHEKGVFELF